MISLQNFSCSPYICALLGSRNYIIILRCYKICLGYFFPQYLQKVRKYSKFTVLYVIVIPGEMPWRKRRRMFWFVGPGNPLVIAALVR